MAGDLEAEAEIKLITDEFESGSSKIQKEFDAMGKSAKSSGDKTEKSLKTTGDEARKTAEKLKSTGAAGKKAGNDVADGGSKGAAGVKKMGTAAQSTDNSLTTLAVSVIGLGQAVTGVTDAIFGFQEKIVALQRSTFGLKQLTLEVTRQEEDLEAAIRQGTLSTQELTRATQDLGFSYEALHIEQKTVKAEQDALNGEYITFGVNTLGVVAQSLIAVTVLMNTETGAKIANTLATKGLTGATLAAAASVKALTISMLTSPLAPYAIAAIGAGAAFIALNDNILRVRDSVEDLVGAERGSIPTLGFSLTGLGEDTDDASESMRNYAKEADDFTRRINENTIPGLDGLSSSTEKSGNAFDTFAAKVKNASAELDSFKKKRSLDEINTGLETATKNIESLVNARTQALQATIIAANLLGIGGGNAFTLQSNLDAANIAGSNASLLSAINSFDTFGVSSAFASAFGGGPATSTFGVSNSSFGVPSGTSFSRSGPSAHRTASGKSSKHGGSNRTVKFNLFAEERKLNSELLNSTGLSLQQLQSITGLDLFNEDTYGAAGRTALDGNFGSYTRYVAAQVARGQLQAARAKAAESNRTEVQTRASIAQQLIQLDPVQFPSFQALLTVNSKTLQNLLADENSEISGISNLTNLSSNEIVSLRQSEQGRRDISGISLFMQRTQKEMLISTTV